MTATTRGRAIGSHQSPRMLNDEWLTPPSIISALGRFDLDPCAPIVRPWPTAAEHFTKEDDGLSRQWTGRVWLNPPYSSQAREWLARLADHGDGIALTFARTETKWFVDTIWRRADAVLFIAGRLHFHYVNGDRAPANAGAPSVLAAYGAPNAQRLCTAKIPGTYISLTADAPAGPPVSA